MPTNEERREVAQKLRGLPIDMYSTIDEWEQDGLFINNSVSDVGDYSQIHDAVFGYFPAEYMHPADYKELHECLADLIEPEIITCEFDSQACGKRRCKRCGAFVSVDSVWDCFGCIPIRYCPNCGAKVVEE